VHIQQILIDHRRDNGSKTTPRGQQVLGVCLQPLHPELCGLFNVEIPILPSCAEIVCVVECSVVE